MTDQSESSSDVSAQFLFLLKNRAPAAANRALSENREAELNEAVGT